MVTENEYAQTLADHAEQRLSKSSKSDIHIQRRQVDALEGIGFALLAIRVELTDMREALRELVDRGAEVSNELSNVTDAISDAGESAVLSDIARAVESLGDAVEREVP